MNKSDESNKPNDFETSQMKEQSLVEHLSELRTRVIHGVFWVLLATIGCWGFSEILFDIIRRPISPFLENEGLVFVAPMDKFVAHIKVSLLAGVIISCPFWLYQIWKFVAPGLYKNERKYTLGFLFFSSLLFLLGTNFVYWIVYPLAFEFLLNFGGSIDTPMITISEYLSFFITTTFLFGLAFELPLILTLLGIMGIVDKAFLIRHRRYAIVILALLSALITPPDIVSMLLMIAPLLFLYELGVIMVGFFSQKGAE